MMRRKLRPTPGFVKTEGLTEGLSLAKIASALEAKRNK